MTRKHSYRQLAKRRFANYILYILQGEPTLDKTYFMTKNNFKMYQSAQNIAKYLKKEYPKGEINLLQYSPYMREIRDILESKNKTQTELF